MIKLSSNGYRPIVSLLLHHTIVIQLASNQTSFVILRAPKQFKSSRLQTERPLRLGGISQLAVAPSWWRHLMRGLFLHYIYTRVAVSMVDLNHLRPCVLTKPLT